MKSIIKDPAKGQYKNNAKTADMWWKRTLQNMKFTGDNVKKGSEVIGWTCDAEIIKDLATYNMTGPVIDILNMRIPGIWTIGLHDNMASIKIPGFDFASTQCNLFMETDAIVSLGRSITWEIDTALITRTTSTINTIIDRVIATIDRLYGMTIDDATLSKLNVLIAHSAAQIGVQQKDIMRSIPFRRYLQMVALSSIPTKSFKKKIHGLVGINHDALLIARYI